MERLPLVQCASTVETFDEGKIVLIMLQYALKPDAKTIQSKSQVEHFGGMDYDSALGAGGHQMVVTHEGYAIPLHVRNGLYYIDMSPETDDELELFPHVFSQLMLRGTPISSMKNFFIMLRILLSIFLSSKHGVMVEILLLFCFGNLNSLILTCSDLPITLEHHEATLNTLSIMSQTMKRRLPDLNALLPNFGWVGKECIQDTLEKTTQCYQADKTVSMRKHFKSRFPASNVHHLPEWYSTATFISDLPACDDGIPGHGGCLPQVYGGLDSELLSAYLMATAHELPHTLRDFIHEYGAMEGLKSDNASQKNPLP